MLKYLPLILLTLSSVQAKELAYLDAENTEQALGMVAMDIRMNEEIRVYCGAEFPQAKRTVDYHALLWSTNNEPEIEAVESYLSNTNRVKQESEMAPFVANSLADFKSAAKVIGIDKVCGGSIEQIKSGESNVANRTPKASAFLKEYLQTHPLPTTEAGKRNMNIGCIAQSFNQNTDLDIARASCNCITDIIYKDFTDAELAELDRVARAKGDAASLSSLQRVKPKLVACRSPVAGA